MKWDDVFGYKWLIIGLQAWKISLGTEVGYITVTKLGVLTCLKMRWAMRFWRYSITSDEIDIDKV